MYISFQVLERAGYYVEVGDNGVEICGTGTVETASAMEKVLADAYPHLSDRERGTMVAEILDRAMWLDIARLLS